MLPRSLVTISLLAGMAALIGCGQTNPEVQAYRERFAGAMPAYLDTPAKGCVDEPTPGVSSEIAWYPWSDHWIVEFEVHLRGRLLILDNESDLGARGGHDQSDELQVSANNLRLQSDHPSLFSSDPEVVRTVAKVVLWDHKVGVYTDGSAAMETEGDVSLIDLREGCSWPELRISGGSAPRAKERAGDAWGEPPHVLDELVALPREP